MVQEPSQSNSSDYFEGDDSQFLEALGTITLPGDVPVEQKTSQDLEEEAEPPPLAQPLKRRYSQLFDDDEEATVHVEAENDTYGAAHFGNFGEYMRRKRAKLQIQNAQMSQDSGDDGIFKGLAIYINGWTKPSVQDLRQLIVQHGGIFHAYLDKKAMVTHIITCSLTPAKIREFKNMKVVRPEWLTESVKEGRLLPWRNYIYIHEERQESTQGAKNQQQKLVDKPEKKPTKPTVYTTDPLTREHAALIPGYAADRSNPSAQRAMKNPEWRKAHTSVSSDFIDGYYRNSRLHHLSTWKSELKDLVQEAQERAESGPLEEHVGKIGSEAGVSMRGAELVMKSPSKWKGKGKAVDDQERVIMHCDFDCFFVSAGLISRPELKGKPVVVITIPYEFERYKQFSLLFYTVLMSHADDLQAVSVDEALIDATITVNQLRAQSGTEDPAKDYAEKIRAEVRKATGCEISIGISHNILLARLATRRAKPGGSYHLLMEEVPEFLAPLCISDLHGFGWSTKQKAIEKLGSDNLAELTKKSKGVLIDALGKSTGETLYNALRGIDDKALESDKPRKSVSCEINYGIRFENNEQAETFVKQMAVEVKKRLDAVGMLGRSITLKFLGHGICDLFNKQMPLIGPGGKATSDDQIIGDHAWRLLKLFNFDPRELRGIGIQIQKLESASTANAAPPGQKVLPFKLKPAAVGTSKDAGASHSIPQSTSKKDEQTNGDPVKPSTVTFDLPSFSQVDRSVFDALPRDVREELENEYKRRSASPFTSAAPVPDSRRLNNRPLAGASIFPTRRSVTPSVFPQRPLANHKRITQQLAPRSRAAISPRKSILSVWAAKEQEKQAKKAAGVQISDAALRELKLDPEVFRALPKKIQREQLTRARILRDKGYIPEPPAERKILKPKKHELPPGYVVYRAPKPKARHPQPPFLRQQGKDKKEKLYFTETDDIQRIVETWVTTYQHWAPREKDVEFLAKFLIQSVDRERATDVGVERAVAVMKWWLVLLRRLFPASEFYEDDSDDDENAMHRNKVGEAWWDALHGVQRKMDEVTRKRFGGRLSYK
ncbi:hypothetical protein D9613_003349 [Agrocybe pediades]|uniref:DNA repair protein REV1 n=1 Tax=Agrocybe pediades TaxID=84607 RepID=A0A8H4VNU5_9AGAR|nr:hypothetical protein D9613_003349 [Agrocybe pediades]